MDELEGAEIVLSPDFLQANNPYKNTPRLRMIIVTHLMGQEKYEIADAEHLIEEAEKIVAYVAGPEPEPKEVKNDKPSPGTSDSVGGYL